MTDRVPIALHGYHRKLQEHLDRFRKLHGSAREQLDAAAVEHLAQLEKARTDAAVLGVAESLQEPS